MATSWMKGVARGIENRHTEGTFRKYCGGKTTCACVAKGKASGNPTIVKRATLAGVFLKCGK